MKIDVNAYLVDKVSKNGKPYKAIEIFITDNVKKLVFLSDAEYELLQLRLKKSN